MKAECRSVLWVTTSPWPLCTSTLTLRWSPIGPKRQDKATVDCITAASWVWGSHNTKQRTEMVWAPRVHCEFWLWWHPRIGPAPQSHTVAGNTTERLLSLCMRFHRRTTLREPLHWVIWPVRSKYSRKWSGHMTNKSSLLWGGEISPSRF